MLHAAPNGASCPFCLPLLESILIVIWLVVFGLQVNQETSSKSFSWHEISKFGSSRMIL
jgi:hypothetical protein